MESSVPVFDSILCFRTFTAGENKSSFILLLTFLLSPSWARERGNVLLKFPLSSGWHSSGQAVRGSFTNASMWDTLCTLCGSAERVGWKILLGLSCAFFGCGGPKARAYSSVNWQLHLSSGSTGVWSQLTNLLQDPPWSVLERFIT